MRLVVFATLVDGKTGVSDQLELKGIGDDEDGEVYIRDAVDDFLSRLLFAFADAKKEGITIQYTQTDDMSGYRLEVFQDHSRAKGNDCTFRIVWGEHTVFQAPEYYGAERVIERSQAWFEAQLKLLRMPPPGSP